MQQCAAATRKSMQFNKREDSIWFGFLFLNCGLYLGLMLWQNECNAYKIEIIKHETDDQLGIHSNNSKLISMTENLNNKINNFKREEMRK